MSNYAERERPTLCGPSTYCGNMAWLWASRWQTAGGDIIFPVDKDLTLTADQILELLERGELDAEGVRKSVEAQASASRMGKLFKGVH